MSHSSANEPPSDEAVMAEWQRIEDARIAEDREEAQDDAETAPPPTRTWAWVVLGVALVAGIAATVILNAWLRPTPQVEESP